MTTGASADDDPLANVAAIFGSVRPSSRPGEHERPADTDDATVAALGELSAALEVVEHARGHLYAFHRLSGTADGQLQSAVRSLRDAGHPGIADRIDQVLVGRDVVPGHWTFQLVEEYDSNYWLAFRAVEEATRRHLMGGVRHVFEADMKRHEQSRERTPAAGDD